MANILLVEDTDYQNELVQLLTQLGHVVRAVESITEAVHAVSTVSFDLVITKVKLSDPPPLTGIQLCVMIKTTNATIPVIVINDDNHAKEAELAKADAFVETTFTPSQIKALVAGLLP